MSLSLDLSIAHLSRFAKMFAKRLEKLEITTVRDLLFYFPFRYEDRSVVLPIAELTPGTLATIRGTVDLIHSRRSPQKRMILTEAVVRDASGAVKVIWFRQPYIAKTIKPGADVYLSGRVDDGQYGMQLTSPTYELAQREQVHTGRIVPVYSLTSTITQKQLRTMIKMAISFAPSLVDWLSDDLRRSFHLIGLSAAITQIHFPETEDARRQAEHRLKFDELFFIQLMHARTRALITQYHAPRIHFHEEETKAFLASLPFILTNDQRKSAWRMLQDMEKDHPMNCLLEGDVGSGKTVVAALAALNVLLSGFSVALMAPTEILAEQHHRTFQQLFAQQPCTLILRTATHKARRQKKDQSSLPSLFIGTHALIQKTLHMEQLGLVIIDEQHRFGVAQRRLLKGKGMTPHFLSMTATPIPRTLALTVYGDLELLLLREMPKGRMPIETSIVPPHDRFSVYAFIVSEIKKGRQAFVICPLIDPSDRLGVRAAKDEYERLSKEIFSEYTVGLLHGRMKSKEKERVMRSFVCNEIQILVSTAVVEVGVDIPNATVMMIEGAERFGLAQLHQFRGRVGRSDHQSYCFLFTESMGEKTMERLHAVERSTDGFALADEDLRLRGPGELYGIRQSGVEGLKIASLSDVTIIEKTKKAVELLLAKDPTLNSWPLLKSRIEEWEGRIHLE